MSDGSPSASGRLPDLYALLGLEALEPDRARIEQSLQRLASQIQVRSRATAQDASTQAQIQRARKLFELGKRQLLDPARKARYDQQWHMVYGSTAAASSTPTWDMKELQAVLPGGDPHAPFDPAEFLASRPPEAGMRYEEDFDKLSSLLAPYQASAESAAPSNASASPVSASHAVASHAVKVGMADAQAVTPLAQRLRKQQGPALLWPAVSMLAAVGVVLGVAYWRLQPATVQPATHNAGLAANSPLDAIPALAAVGGNAAATAQSAATTSPGVAAPRRSGLPSVPGADAIMPPTALAQPDPFISAAPTTVQNNAMQNSSMQNIGMQDRDLQTNGMQPQAIQGSGLQGSGIQEGAASTASGAGQAISLSDEERQQWTNSMLAAREALGQQQFAQATEQLAGLRALAKTQLQTQQLARLMSIAQLAQRFNQALGRALSGMGAAESFSFGASGLASFVEADNQRVILRIEGRNQAYAMTQLPVEIAFAIVDQAMDREHPQSLAAKAAFTLVHPAAQGDERAVQEAQQMMADAVDARAVAQDMQQALQDDFVLPE